MFGLLAGVAFVACTNDDDPAGASPVNGGDKVATADKYIAVNLKMPSGAATRADGDETVAPGESDVKKATFLFFRGNVQVALPFSITLPGNDANGDAWTPGDGLKKSALIVMKEPTDIPTSLVVLINYMPEVKQETKLDELQKIVADYSDTSTGFVMSNAVYNDAAGNVIGAPVSADNVKNDVQAAKANPVKVYVDRVLAKVTVTTDSELDPEGGIATGVEGIKAVIKGWGLVYENTQSYLIKKLGTTYDYAWTWNDAANHRSYWAEAAEYKTKTVKDEQNNDVVTGPSYNDPDLPQLDAVLYTQENTNNQTWTDGAAANPTAVVVFATLMNGTSAVDLYKFGNVLLAADDIKTLLVNKAIKKFYTKDADGGYIPVKASDFTMSEPDPAAGEDYQAKMYLTTTLAKVYYDVKEADDGSVTAKEYDNTGVNNDLKNNLGELVELFKGGATYYYVPIKQHVAEGENDNDVYGIIRNHFYQIKITSISGLGTAIPDQGQPIIPEKPKDDKYYLGAEINILDWVIKEQDVALGAE